MSTMPAQDDASRPMSSEEKRVIFASSLGTTFEWYDFYLYGSLSTIIAKQFFAGLNETAAFLAALLAFAAGFLVRPLGALVFGRVGDLVGRKYTFLVTITLMGLSTFLVGIIPGYLAIGVLAPTVLILLRIIQGLALGGEYGGAATYVAEHAPRGRRGYYTGWIQTTATAGLFLSLIVILGTRNLMGEAAFQDWGWRIPFLVSVLLLAISVWIRLQLAESPAFQRMKDQGTRSKAPLTEAFGQWKNLKIAIIALFGLVAGEAVIWYSGQFYALLYLTKTLRVDPTMASILLAIALAIGTPFYVLFGGLSDRIGRKPIMLAGFLLAAVFYLPIFKAITHYANPALETALATSQVTVIADPADCSVQFDPVGKAQFTTSCDVAKNFLANGSVAYVNQTAPAGTVAKIKIGDAEVASYSATGLDAAAAKAKAAEFSATAFQALKAHNYPVSVKTEPIRNPDGTPAKNADGSDQTKTSYAMAPADPAGINKPMLVLVLTVLVLLVTLVYGPMAAALVELFPTRIRYTGMSLPYHIGNGWFGGMVPFVVFAMVASNGDIYYGLWYPIVVAAATFVIGLLFVPETKDRDIYAND
ncbi:MFS transporter [Labrys wisconsinensis]|uniref:MFS family permease n=1 Tax=Labrys wisconsinensis TaxID=425677 RepID=A0ABU0J8Y2_9HYPH|nr:MFS transporter [Labrys wisconsinensis]MDQ0470740.1 MFS family permease [Labrys wisconsinensis]